MKLSKHYLKKRLPQYDDEDLQDMYYLGCMAALNYKPSKSKFGHWAYFYFIQFFGSKNNHNQKRKGTRFLDRLNAVPVDFDHLHGGAVVNKCHDFTDAEFRVDFERLLKLISGKNKKAADILRTKVERDIPVSVASELHGKYPQYFRHCMDFWLADIIRDMIYVDC